MLLYQYIYTHIYIYTYIYICIYSIAHFLLYIIYCRALTGTAADPKETFLGAHTSHVSNWVRNGQVRKAWKTKHDGKQKGTTEKHIIAEGRPVLVGSFIYIVPCFGKGHLCIVFVLVGSFMFCVLFW